MRRLMAAVSLVMVVVGAACEELDHPSEVKDLRLLAAAVDPPEVILDSAQGDSPPPELALRALVADPQGHGRPLTWSIRACANDPSAPVAPGAGTEASGNYPAGGARNTVGSARCPADSATSMQVQSAMPFDGQPARVTLPGSLLIAALARDVFPGHLGNLHGGFDLGLPINLDIELRVPATGEVVAGVKRVIFWPTPVRADHRPNVNPVIKELHLWRARDARTLELRHGPEILGPAGAPVVAGQAVYLQPVGAEAESYVTTVLDRNTDKARVLEVPAENLRFSFFATAGKFEPAETSSTLPFGAVMTARVPLEARYVPPPAEELPLDQTDGTRSARVKIWVVARDERGGASWLEQQLLVTESGPTFSRIVR